MWLFRSSSIDTLKQRRNVGALVGRLRHRDPRVRVAACNALADIYAIPSGLARAFDRQCDDNKRILAAIERLTADTDVVLANTANDGLQRIAFLKAEHQIRICKGYHDDWKGCEEAVTNMREMVDQGQVAYPRAVEACRGLLARVTSSSGEHAKSAAIFLLEHLARISHQD
jgi:hypothetical protein